MLESKDPKFMKQMGEFICTSSEYEAPETKPSARKHSMAWNTNRFESCRQWGTRTALPSQVHPAAKHANKHYIESIQNTGVEKDRKGTSKITLKYPSIAINRSVISTGFKYSAQLPIADFFEAFAPYPTLLINPMLYAHWGIWRILQMRTVLEQSQAVRAAPHTAAAPR